jgi:hypothetical protein
VARGLTWIRANDFPAAARPVTVIDDPRRGRGAWTIDDEGCPPVRPACSIVAVPSACCLIGRRAAP